MKKLLLILPGYCVGLGSLLLITSRTMLAFGSDSKMITVQVNRFGEQYLDVVALVFLWAVCLVGVLALYRVLKEKNQTLVVDHGSSFPGFPGPRDGFGSCSDVAGREPWMADPIACEKTLGLSDEPVVSLEDDGTGGVFVVMVPVSKK